MKYQEPQTRTLYEIRIEFKDLTNKQLRAILSAEDRLDYLHNEIEFDYHYDSKTHSRWWWIKTNKKIKVKEEIT